jgi:hypothetical protein
MRTIPLYAIKATSISICLLLVTGSTFGTCIVVLRTPNMIVIASDTLFQEGKNNTWGYSHHCKIHSIDRKFFVLSGLSQDLESDFMPVKIVSDVLRRQGRLKTQAEVASQRIEAPLLKAIQRIYRDVSPELSKRIIGGGSDEGTTMLQMAVVGIEEGVSKVIVVNFDKVVDASGFPIGVKHDIALCPGKACPDGKQGWWLGERRAIDSRLSSSVPYWTGAYIKEAVGLVELEATDKPDLVGKPIDVLLIRTVGQPKWIQKGECPEND